MYLNSSKLLLEKIIDTLKCKMHEQIKILFFRNKLQREVFCVTLEMDAQYIIAQRRFY